MKLQAIETVGFKSFADKIEVVFGDGITAIVGPNGSGKSNIADAIRWVLGEQSIRTLRGSSMEDVIFSGSAARRALNIAEVSLFFSNHDGVLPIDYKEVTICRRLFRSGESAYFINKTACRLKDIHDLFADTGLGKGSLSIVGQNKVDEILNGRPEERRTLFEEAAGITRYKLRKRDAMRRLEETENNLTRLNDIRSEITGRLEPMRESAEKTTRHNELQEQLSGRRVTLAVRKIDKALKMTEEAQLQKNALKDEEESLTTESAIQDNKIFLFTEKLSELSSLLGHIQQNIAQGEAMAERLAGQKAVFGERMEQHKERSLSIKLDLERVGEQTTQFAERLGQLRERLTEQENTEKAAEGDKEKWSKELAAKEQLIGEIERAQEEEQINAFERKRAILQMGNDIRALETAVSGIARKKEQLAAEEADASKELGGLKESLEKYRQNLLELQNNKQLHKADGETTERSLDQIGKELQERRARGQKLEEDIVTLTARINILDKLQREYEGFSYSVKKIMSAKTAWRTGVKGVIGELLAVPGNLVVAVETALGAAMQNIVTADDQTAKLAVEYLKKEKVGRATFLPLKNLRITRPGQEEKASAKLPGILGFAAELVETGEEIRPALDFLLGRTLVAESLEAAIEVGRRCGARLRIVTLDGDIINTGGAISGGSRSSKEAGFLSRSQEISDNKEKLTALSLTGEENRRGQEKLKAGISETQEKLAGISGKINVIEREIASIEAYWHETQKQEQQKQLGLSTIQFEYAEAVKEEEELSGNLSKLKEEKAQAESAEEEISGLAGQLQADMQEAKKERDLASAKFNEANIRFETAHNSTLLLQEQLAGILAEGGQYKENKERLEKELAGFEKSIAAAEKEESAVKRQILENAENLELVRQQRDQETTRQLELLSEQKLLEQAGRDIKTRLSAVQNRLRNAESIFVRYQTELSLADAQLKEQYALTLEEARAFCLGSVSDGELVKQAEELEALLGQLGPVNPAAIEEYREVKERHDFMLAQYEDLTGAKQQLESLINEIDRTMSKRFREAFNAINAFFMECFSRLFGGGSASLKLLDPSDILSTGIDIIVQPPGKKLQTLALLSGGERALTVIALLFAMLSYRPAPFCVLDEIDAALDEVNVERFSRFLTDFAQNTQFVVITHRKGTMQASHLMHGITMEESGVSKLLSVKMKEKGALA